MTDTNEDRLEEIKQNIKDAECMGEISYISYEDLGWLIKEVELLREELASVEFRRIK